MDMLWILEPGESVIWLFLKINLSTTISESRPFFSREDDVRKTKKLVLETRKKYFAVSRDWAGSFIKIYS